MQWISFVPPHRAEVSDRKVAKGKKNPSPAANRFNDRPSEFNAQGGSPQGTMSADFWSGYLSGAAGILIGNPFDVIKVRLQAFRDPSRTPSTPLRSTPQSERPFPTTARTASSGTIAQQSASTPSNHAGTASRPRFILPLRSLESLQYPLAGAAAPILGYGALNALLFVSYNRTEAALTRILDHSDNTTNSTAAATAAATTTIKNDPAHPRPLVTWLAGAAAGLASWAVSTPTELIKCRAQLGTPSHRSWDVARQVWRAEGLRGLYLGGGVTALRDSLGYGFYFWTYSLLTRGWVSSPSLSPASQGASDDGGVGGSTSGSTSSGDGPRSDGNRLLAEAPKVLLAGGLSGIATWASIYPLDVIKTRVQAQIAGSGTRSGAEEKRIGAWAMSRRILRDEGLGALFRGLGVCSLRAFVVNAVQWGVYELAMYQLGEGRW